jgi:hypothetical protein
MAIVVPHHSTVHFGNIDVPLVTADVLVGYSVGNNFPAKTDVQEIGMDF